MDLTIATPLRPESFLEATCPHQAAWGTPRRGIQLWRWPFKLAHIRDITVLVRHRLIRLTEAEGTVLTTPTGQQLIVRLGPDEARTVAVYSSDEPCATVLELCGPWTREDAVLLAIRPALLPMHRGSLAAENDVRCGPDRLDVRSRTFGIGFSVLAARGQVSFATRGDLIIARFAGPAPARLVFVAGTPRQPVREAAHLRGLDPDRPPTQLARLLSSLPDVRFDDTSFFRPLAWSAISLQRLWVVNPDLGPGLISGYGPADGDPLRPRYAWFFDEPMLANVAYTRLGLTAPVRDAFRMLARYQARDGKPVHEITQSLRYWPEFFREFPYAYMHADSGPFFILGHWLFWRGSGDTRFLSDHWPAILRAYRWCTEQIDRKSGLFVVRRGEWGGTEASIDIERDIFTNGVWVASLQALADMAAFLGDRKTEADARQRFDRYAPLVEGAFWDQRGERFFWGYRRDGGRIPHCFPQAGVPGWLGAFSQHRVRRTVSYWLGPDYATPWGIRTLPRTDSQYDPDGYQLGTVWPVWTAAVQLAALRSGLQGSIYRQWWTALQAMFLAETNGHMPELLRGDRFQLATGAVQHQMFSHLLPVNVLIDGFLGVSVHAPRRMVWLRPSLPPGVRHAKAHGLYFGEHERFDLSYEKTERAYIVDLDLQALAGPVRLRLDLRPVQDLPPVALVNGKRVAAHRVAGRVRVEVELSPERHRILITWAPTSCR